MVETKKKHPCSVHEDITTVYCWNNKLSFTAGADYTPLEVDITIPETMSACYNITIIDDDIVEVSESFSVELINVVGIDTLVRDIGITILPNNENIDSKLTNIELVYSQA